LEYYNQYKSYRNALLLSIQNKRPSPSAVATRNS
jgi:hypothetical protein